MYVVLACNLVELVILDVSGLVRFTEEGIMMNMNEHQQMNTNKHGMMHIYICNSLTLGEEVDFLGFSISLAISHFSISAICNARLQLRMLACWTIWGCDQ